MVRPGHEGPSASKAEPAIDGKRPTYRYGAVAIAEKSSLLPSNPQDVGWTWWIIPPIAAGISAAMLFFWMRWWAAAMFTAVTAFMYLLFAYAAVRESADDPLARWPPWWMFHSLWVCWLAAILAIPIAIGFMPDSMLRPSGVTNDIGGFADTNAEDDDADD